MRFNWSHYISVAFSKAWTGCKNKPMVKVIGSIFNTKIDTSLAPVSLTKNQTYVEYLFGYHDQVTLWMRAPFLFRLWNLIRLNKFEIRIHKNVRRKHNNTLLWSVNKCQRGQNLKWTKCTLVINNIYRIPSNDRYLTRLANATLH